MSLKLNIDLISANPGCIDIAVVVSRACLADRHPPCLCLTTSPPVQDRKQNKVKKTTGRDKDMEITYQLLSQAKKKNLDLEKNI